MVQEFKSAVVPSDNPKSLSTRKTIDFSGVPIDEMRNEVVKRAVQHLGRKQFNNMGKIIREAFKQAPAPFNTLEVALMMTGIEGFQVVLMLAVEWKVEDYITDFDDKMNLWLDNQKKKD